MRDNGDVIDLNTGKELEANDFAKMHENVKMQLDSPERVNSKNHIKQSDLWNTTKSIIKIQKQLVKGYSFDTMGLQGMINAMFTFIHGIVKPGNDKPIETTVKNCFNCAHSFENVLKQPCCTKRENMLIEDIFEGCDLYEEVKSNG